MSGDFSRSTFDPKKHYSGVRMQQGRVQLDADWNEQVDLAAEALRARTGDIVGASGGPAGAAGFAVVAESALFFGGKGDLVEAPAREEYALRARDHVTLEAVVSGSGGPIFSAGHLLLTLEDDGRLRFQHGGADAVVTSEPQAWDRPRRVAVVHDADTITMYLDGARIAAGKARDAGPSDPVIEVGEELLIEAGDVEVELFAPKPRGHRGVALRIGGEAHGAARSFHGTIRSVRLWKAALSAAEVKAPAERPSASDPLLLASFPLDEGAGHRVRDHSPLANDAHLTGPAGHRPRWACSSLRIGRGRYYVGGVLCENDAEVAFTDQPDLPGERLPETKGTYLAVLEVRDRIVDALQDPQLLEVALGGVDTAVRTKTVWQVRLLPLPHGVPHDHGQRALAELSAPSGAMRARCELGAGTELPGNTLHRVEIHDDGEAAGSEPEPRAWLEVIAVAGEPTTVEAVRAGGGSWRAGRWVEIDGAGKPILARLVRVDAAARRFTLDRPIAAKPPTGRLRMRRIAGFKWSSNNGLDALPIASVEPVAAIPGRPAIGTVPATTSVILAERVGHHGATLRKGDWIEVIGDRELYRGDPAPLAKIKDISYDGYTLTLQDPLPEGAGQGSRAFVRRWDAAASDRAVLPARVEETQLGHGIRVQFTGSGPYRTGDHWLMPARVQRRGIEWPRDASGPAACAPLGARRFARLALLHVEDDGVLVHDLRSTFVPLADLRVPGAELIGPITIRGALHVTGAATIDEEARAQRFGGELPPASVGHRELVDHAVSGSKLAPQSIHAEHLSAGIGFVPEGFSILGPSPVPPAGFVYAHRHIEVPNPAPAWGQAPALPDRGGRTVLVTIGEALYALPEHDLAIYRHDEPQRRWTVAGARRAARRAFGAAAVGHEIHVVGGLDEHGLARADHEIFDTLAGGTAQPARGKLGRARAHLGAAALGDLVFAVGGVEGRIPDWLRDLFLWLGLPRAWFHPTASSDALEVYDPRARRWRPLPPLRAARSDFGLAVLHDRLHVVGGRSSRLLGPPEARRDHEAFAPARRQWEERAPLAAPRAELGAAVVDGELYATGGLGPDGPVATVEAYAPIGDAWHAATRLPEPRHDHGSTGLFGDLFVVGGRRGKDPLASAEACAVASTLFVHTKATPGAHGHHGGQASAGTRGSAEAPRTAEPHAHHAARAVLEPPEAPSAQTARRLFVAAAILVLLAALIYGYAPGPSAAPSRGAAPTGAANAAASPDAGEVLDAGLDAGHHAGKPVH